MKPSHGIHNFLYKYLKTTINKVKTMWQFCYYRQSKLQLQNAALSSYLSITATKLAYMEI
jgi:hypothetical protein